MTCWNTTCIEELCLCPLEALHLSKNLSRKRKYIIRIQNVFKRLIHTSQESFCPLAYPAQRKLLRITLECPAVWNISWHTLFSITGTCTSCNRLGTPPPGKEKQDSSLLLSHSINGLSLMKISITILSFYASYKISIQLFNIKSTNKMALQFIQLGITLVHWFKVLMVCDMRKYKLIANFYWDFQKITTEWMHQMFLSVGYKCSVAATWYVTITW